jgi:hypothetical protein
MRKRIYLATITMVLALMLVSSVAYAAPPVSDNSVTKAEAENAALQYVARFSSSIMPEWSNAYVSEPIPYYSFVDDTIAAYEFTVLNNGDDVGFIVISARKDWMPVLELSSGNAPSSKLTDAKRIAVENGYISNNDTNDTVAPKIYYYGALSQSVQLGDKMKNEGIVISLYSGLIGQKPKGQKALQMDKDKAKAAWIEVGQAEAPALSPGKIQPLTGVWKTISGVTAFYQASYQGDRNCDNGNDPSASYPSCVGIANDPWYNWDGCAPIAGAMVLNYWQTHGYPNLPTGVYADEILIDHGHAKMNTDVTGATLPQYIASGIRLVSNIYNYHFQATSYSTVNWSDIINEVNANRPFVLSVWGSPVYPNGHSVCGLGYISDTGQQLVGVYSTVDTSLHWILFNNWSSAMITKVLPAN